VPGSRRFGRFGEAAVWVLVALAGGPRGATRLLDEVRDSDGPVGPGTLYGAIARLERLDLIEATRDGHGRPAYRLARASQRG
jgi:DNA-binding PadR family transcriptional regulator